jgi:hypothetical protein
VNQPKAATKRPGKAKTKGPVAHTGSAHTHPEVVEALIDRAKNHPLGTEFLSQGSLDSVAAAFQAHAFTVEAAREKLQGDTL